MKNIWIHTVVIFILSVIMTIGANAQPYGGRGLGPCGQGDQRAHWQGPGQGFHEGYRQGGANPGARMEAIPDLTEEQQDQLTSLRLQHYKEMKPLRAELAELNARKRTLISQEEVDMKAIDKVIDQQTTLMNKMQKQQLRNRLACREVLTDEQLMILDQRKMLRGKRGISM